ncbi:hypothetical protein [Chitinophaga vietnamensis]|uniref:hypothetical protein n=1 Tax=Chitinophaga vietnamensis TaxID=2593957 RepID=UPI0011777C8C|nr:hypothetical protein [Chitinophaga vietnamensis]
MNPRKLFVIAGYPYSGKHITLQQLFRRKHFFPLKAPISLDKPEQGQFVVAGSARRPQNAAYYRKRLYEILERHRQTDAAFVMTMSLVFDGGVHDCTEMLRMLHAAWFEPHYFILRSSWYDKTLVKEEDIEQLASYTPGAFLHDMDLLVTRSPLRMQQRVEAIRQVMERLVSR